MTFIMYQGDFKKLTVGKQYINGNCQLFFIVDCLSGEEYPYVAQDDSRWSKEGKPHWSDQGVGNSLQKEVYFVESLDEPEEVQ